MPVAVAEALEAAGPAAVVTAAAPAAVVGPAAAAAAVGADGGLSHEELQQQGCHYQRLTSWWRWLAWAHLLPQVQQKHPIPLMEEPLAVALPLSQPVAHREY